MNSLISAAAARRAFVMQRAEVIEALERLQVTVHQSHTCTKRLS
jgi:NADH:ubiquinone oxidoreductase subunit F (NADH-binding)